MDREMGNEMEFETRNWREMGNEMEFETRNGGKWETRRDKILYFSTKKEKKGKKTGKQEKTLKKEEEKNRKLQEIQKRYLDEVSGNAENGNEFSTRFRKMLKTETRPKTRSFPMSRNDDSRAKARYRCRPTAGDQVLTLTAGGLSPANDGAVCLPLHVPRSGGLCRRWRERPCRHGGKGVPLPSTTSLPP